MQMDYLSKETGNGQIIMMHLYGDEVLFDE